MQQGRKWSWIGIAAMGAMLCAPLGWAAPQQDHQFAKMAAQGNYSEVKMAELAQQKSNNEQVKDFAKRMVQDHSQANRELEQIASKQGINVQKKLDPVDQTEYDRLSKLSGPEFDKEYAKL